MQQTTPRRRRRSTPPPSDKQTRDVESLERPRRGGGARRRQHHHLSRPPPQSVRQSVRRSAILFPPPYRTTFLPCSLLPFPSRQLLTAAPSYIHPSIHPSSLIRARTRCGLDGVKATIWTHPTRLKCTVGCSHFRMMPRSGEKWKREDG